MTFWDFVHQHDGFLYLVTGLALGLVARWLDNRRRR